MRPTSKHTPPRRQRLAPAYARELTLDRYVAAARKRAKRGVAILEEFNRAADV